MIEGAFYLVDKSAWEWARRDASARDDLAALDGLLAACHLTSLELAYSARNVTDHARVLAGQRRLVWLPVTEECMDRALEIAAALAANGQHRTPIPDVIIAATAQVHGATVVHVDGDYERIAELTGQPQHRLLTS